MTTAGIIPVLQDTPRLKEIPPSSVAARDAAILAGDKSAFEDLVRAESPRLYKMIYRITQNEDEARSLLQETFLQSYERLSSFRKESKLTTWIYAIGLNLARTAKRKSRRMRTLAHEEFEALRPQFVRGSYAGSIKSWSAEYNLERKERISLLNNAIARLPQQHRTIVEMKDIDGMSTKDVAKALNISTGAVRVRLHRARQALRTLLAPYFSGALAP